jgi:hypothetical protein
VSSLKTSEGDRRRKPAICIIELCCSITSHDDRSLLCGSLDAHAIPITLLMIPKFPMNNLEA